MGFRNIVCRAQNRRSPRRRIQNVDVAMCKKNFHSRNQDPDSLFQNWRYKNNPEAVQPKAVRDARMTVFENHEVRRSYFKDESKFSIWWIRLLDNNMKHIPTPKIGRYITNLTPHPVALTRQTIIMPSQFLFTVSIEFPSITFSASYRYPSLGLAIKMSLRLSIPFESGCEFWRFDVGVEPV